MKQIWKLVFVLAMTGLSMPGLASAADLTLREQPSGPLPEKGIWGAIAYSEPDSRHGFFWGADKREEAMEEALQHCENAGGEACAVVSVFRNHRHWDDDDGTGFPYEACSALAVGAEDEKGTRRWGVSSAKRRRAAEEAALQHCGGEENQCKIREWVCT